MQKHVIENLENSTRSPSSEKRCSFIMDFKVKYFLLVVDGLSSLSPQNLHLKNKKSVSLIQSHLLE